MKSQRQCPYVLQREIKRRTRIPPHARFWRKVTKTTTCWLWTGAVTKFGYGNFTIEREGRSGYQKQALAHRYAYESLRGKIPVGLQLDHLCRNKLCVNPAHLRPSTPRENTLNSNGITAQHARKTHCKRGHPLSGKNLRIMPDGERDCKQCARDWKREKYRKQKLLTCGKPVRRWQRKRGLANSMGC